MQERTSTVTTKGQITIPVDVRRLLDVRPHDRVVFIVEGEQVRLRRVDSVAHRTAGALRGAEPALSAEQEREAAEQAFAEAAETRPAR